MPRKPIGTHPRDGRIIICIEVETKDQLKELALDSNRSLSDYCHFVLTEHVKLAKDN